MKELVIESAYPFISERMLMKILGYKSRTGLNNYKRNHKGFPEGEKRGAKNSIRIFSVAELKRYWERQGYKVTIEKGPTALDLKERKEYEELKEYKQKVEEQQMINLVATSWSSEIAEGLTNA